jgi:hypothetical protein
MLKSIKGICRNGRVELIEPIPPDAEGEVIVTFLTSHVDLAARGIDEARAADLRQRLATFAEDWDRPDMDVYDAI